MSATKMLTMEEVQQHNTKEDMWVVIDGKVFDLTAFGAMGLHPGGMPPLIEVAGQDATDAFYGLHRASILDDPKYARFVVGQVATEPKQKSKHEGDVVPYGESHGFWRKASLYYKPTHHEYRQAVRNFIDSEIRPDVITVDEEGTYPSLELNMKIAQFGILACLVVSEPRATELITELGITLPGGVDPKAYDLFHGLIFSEEFRATGCYGYGDGLFGGCSIGLPPLFKFGSEELVRRLCPDILLGKKRICLAVSEPYAGSDVQNLHCSAVLSEDETHWIVTGVKKWITGGMYADYFTTLVQTPMGPTMMVIERDEDGETCTTRPIKTSYSMAAGTAYVEIMEAQVPRHNVIGKEGMGFMYAMANFNTERWGMVCSGNRLSRLMVEECFKWAMQRKIFGKRLVDQPVIRFKLAQMAAEVEAVHSLLEDVTYQMQESIDRTGSEEELNKRLAGPISLLKYKQTRVAQLCADNACQIFGGRALTRSGMGVLVEKFHRSQKMQAILGGSEEILADFAIRQAIRKAPSDSRL